MDEVRTLEIESLSYGVFGVARDASGVVFVPGTAPGDLVRARIVAERRGYREAELVEVVRPSPVRRSPPCPYLPACGGCTWQHVDYAAQLAAKEQVLRDELVRVGGFGESQLDLRPILGSPEWAYRQRVTLRVGGAHRLGFYRHRSHSLVEIEDCRIAEGAVNRHLPLAREWLRGVSTEIRRLEIAAARPDGDAVVLIANAEGPFRQDGEYHEKFLRAHRSVAGIVLFGKGWRRGFGRPRIALRVEDDLWIESEGGFTQVNAAANRLLVSTALALAAPRPDDRVLDLYCGAGNFTLPLARRVAGVVGVEIDARAIGDARRNADREGIANCRFVGGEAASAARALRAERESFSIVLLDPPRSGAAEVLGELPDLATDRLIYVSCNPATLARDLRRLVGRGFRLGALQPIDLFPQTYHLEIVAALARDARRAATP